MGLAPLVAAVLLAASPVSFVQAHSTGGAYAEPGGASDALLTSWAVLGLRAEGAGSPGSLAYLQSQESSLQTSNDVAIVALAEQALGNRNAALLARLRVQASGQIGETLNSTYWGVLALGHSSAATTRFMLAQQTKAGGFAWFKHGQADSNDTAAALEALRVAGVHGRPVTRAVRFLRSFQRPDGGFELTHGRGSDAQSTAWAIQGERPTLHREEEGAHGGRWAEIVALRAAARARQGWHGRGLRSVRPRDRFAGGLEDATLLRAGSAAAFQERVSRAGRSTTSEPAAPG